MVDTRQDTTVEVPNAAERGLVAKIKDSLPLVGDKKPKVKAENAPKVAVAKVDDDLLNADAAPPAKHELTPIERAAREEQGGPGVFATLKEALPFTKKDHKAVDSAEDQPTTVEKIAHAEPASSEEVEDKVSAPASDVKPGLMSRLKKALPFGAKTTDESPALPKQTGEETARAETAHEKHEESNDLHEASNDDLSERPIIVPPISPAGQPPPTDLDNEVAEPKSIGDAGDASVPAHSTKKKPGFFARLFGNDTATKESSEPVARGSDASAPDAQ